MKVVIDTNVVVSAILKDRNPENVILFIVRQPDFEWIASVEILKEYLEVISRPKFSLPDATIEKWVRTFGSLVRIVEVSQGHDFPRDRKDAKFLACCLAAKADYLITGDKDFSDVYRLGETIILSVSLFKSLVCDTFLTTNGDSS